MEEKPAAETAAEKPAAEAAVDDLFGDAPAKGAPKPAEPAKPAEDDPFAPPAPEKAAEAPDAEAPAAEKPAEPAKPVEDDPFKISAEGELATRVWSDDTGDFRINGRLIAILDGKVRILKQTGKTTTVPFTRLSETDQKYVEQISARYGSGVIGQVAAR